MFRNLVLKLPSLRCTSEYAFSSLYRNRRFRSLSPVQRLQSDTFAVTERSVSCSRAEKVHPIVDISGKSQTRTLCYSKEYYANRQSRNESPEEIQWRENPANEAEKKKADPALVKQPEPLQFESLEQYELEAAKPRSCKSRDLIEAFTDSRRICKFPHLQPCQIQPYGSQTNLYSPVLIRSLNSLKCPRKKKNTPNAPYDFEVNSSNDSPSSSRGQRSYSTSARREPKENRKLSTTKSCIAKEGDSSKEKSFKDAKSAITEDLRSFSTHKLQTFEQFLKPNLQNCQEYWIQQRKGLNFAPPRYSPSINKDEEPPSFPISTSEMRKKRKEEENRKGSIHFKSSYSDLIKLKLREVENAKLKPNNGYVDSTNTDKACVGCLVRNSGKPNKMLDAFKSLPGRRSLTTRSKNNMEESQQLLNSDSASIANISEALITQRNFSKKCSKDYKPKPKKSAVLKKGYDPDCEDVCSPNIKALKKEKAKHLPFEPAKCEPDQQVNKIFLPSKVKLPVHPCLQRPEYRHCKEYKPCPDRADDCLIPRPRQLPKLPINPCPCIDPPQPQITPKLQKLHFNFEDPPKVECHPPPCQTPRADDCNPCKFKPLKPYVPGECECVQPPPMTDVKLKRLPRCEPEEVCRPPRICPIIDPCPPRADECYRPVVKPLPPLTSDCLCIDPPTPTIAPPMKRLDLSVPAPERVCPRPPLCKDLPRADDGLKPKKKKLPKFVPGDCPCEDRPMTNWNLKRLVCEDEPQECIVPDPCKAFPRADWGCWEYPDDVCEIVDPKCIDTTDKCAKPPVKKPCRKKSICETGAGLLEIRNVPKRKFSHDSSTSSLKLYQRVKSKAPSNQFSGKSFKRTTTVSSRKSETVTKLKPPTKKQIDSPPLELIKMLNDLEKTRKYGDEDLLFKPQKEEKIDYENILKTIASTTAQLEKKESSKTPSITTHFKKLKANTLTVPSRAISTTESLSKDETERKKERDCEAKQKCKKIRPTIKAMICNKPCPRYRVCSRPPPEPRPGCKCDKIPVCCEKEESPYSAYTDNLPDTIKPFTTRTPQWTCDRPRYGFHPVYKKEHDPLDPEKAKDKKKYSTYSWLANLPIEEETKTKESLLTNLNRTKSTSRPTSTKETSRLQPMRATKSVIYRAPPKGFLKKTSTPNLSATQNRLMTTKTFQIRRPEPCKKPKGPKGCKKYPSSKTKGEEIQCKTEETCGPRKRWTCKTPYESACTKGRKPPPFPAFSDCLDEEMEEILTECPLDREKYLRMQPRFMNRTPKLNLLKPPPPIQGKIDVLKEQQCLREKFCIENKGVTQTCKNFGKPVPLMKTKEMVVKEKDRECDRMEELKKLGRWPPLTVKSNRRFSTIASGNRFRNYSILGRNNLNDFGRAKGSYTRNYHALIKNVAKPVLADSEGRIKDMLPNMDEAAKVLKQKNNQWKIQQLKICEHNRQTAVARRAKRNYTTYKIRYRKRRAKQHMGYFSRRKFSSGSPILKSKMQYFRGKRYYKTSRPKESTTTEKDRCKLKCPKRNCPKFTLNNCPPKACRKKCHKVPVGLDCSKPFSPYPAFSECKDHEVVAPTCECPFDVERMSDLQPRYSLLQQPTAKVKEFPSQDRIDRALGIEYYKCKHGIEDEGITIGCDSFGEYFNPKSKKNSIVVKETCHQKENECSSSSKDRHDSNMVELLVQDHQSHGTTCCSQTPCETDRKKLEEICISECLKSIPCHLPEEEKFCICQERCKNLFCNKNQELQAYPKPCEVEEKKECEPRPKKIDCEEQRAKKKLKNVECIAVPKPTCPKPPVCKKESLKPPPCGVKTSKSFTQLETIWQKIVNYFKARPNCPQPGDYKKKALKERAEKAASKAGLVVVDPKCLPPEMLKSFKTPKNDCKVCPNQEPTCEPKKTGTRACSPEPNKRSFSTNYQPSRKYSKSMSCNNLEEINKMLEEEEIKRRELRFRANNRHTKKEFGVFPDRKDADTSEALKMSLDLVLHKPVDLSELADRDGRRYPKTYFGYSNIIPSRENILERAWRISIEAYNKYNYPKTYNFFNEFFTRVEKSIKTVEDLEKIKTENVLRELDEFLKSEDPSSTKKKK